MGANPITATIPLDEDGEHHGFLRLPYSRDDSAWGSVMIGLRRYCVHLVAPVTVPVAGAA